MALVPASESDAVGSGDSGAAEAAVAEGCSWSEFDLGAALQELRFGKSLRADA
jgi:hypothetical protein